MLKRARATAALPTKNLTRAKAFYTQKLGLTPGEETPAGVLYELGGGTQVLVFESSGAPSGTHTQISFDVEDLAATVKDLKARGIQFEEYNTPGLKTVDGIAQIGPTKAAWFKDTEGNLLAVGQTVPVKARTS
jgi:catechol 2,3-dioxygenase-like lactoylglutathione lyase family enzyme